MIRCRSVFVLLSLPVLALQACGVQSAPATIVIASLPAPATSTSPPAVTTTPPPLADTAIPSTVPSPACTALDLEAYVAAAAPLLDQLAVASQEATQLEALSTERVTALLGTAADIREQLATIQPPECLQSAHFAALEGAALLSQALDDIASGAYADAEEGLRASFDQTAWAVALIGMQYWEQTPIPQTTP